MLKQTIQQRITQQGKVIPLDKFEWDDLTRELYVPVMDYILDMPDFHNVKLAGVDSSVIKLGNNCNIITGEDCELICGRNSIIATKSYCTITTSDNSEIGEPIKLFVNVFSYCLGRLRTGIECMVVAGNNCTIYVRDYCGYKTGSAPKIMDDDKNANKCPIISHLT